MIGYLPKWTHMGIFGTTGVGKSTLAELICEIEHQNKKMKIIDLQNNKYLEVCSFMRPTRNKRFLSNLRSYRVKPMGFQTDVYHPIVTGLPTKLPEIVQMYTLPIDFFAYEEVLRVLTNDSLGDAAYVSLTQEVEKLKKHDSLPALPTKILESIDRKILKTEGLDKVPMFFYFDSSMSASSANRPILKVKNVGIFSSIGHEFCLTDDRIVQILKDHKTITGFSTRWIDSRHRKIKLAINLYLLMKIRDLARRAGGGLVVYIREARELFPNPRYSDKALKVLGELAEDMIKDCRKAGIHLILDTQTPWDLPDGVLDQLSLKFIFRHDKREADIMDMYVGTPSMDRERIKNIKKLRNFRFYISAPNVPISNNPFGGTSLDYKLSDHLEERDNEIGFIKKSFPDMKEYNTNEFLESLRSDWMQTYEKYSGKFNRRYWKDQERVNARSMGISVSDLRVLKYMYQNQEKKEFTFKEIQNRCGLAKSTAADSIDRLHNNGFIKRGKKGSVIIMDSTIEFVENNIQNFGLVEEKVRSETQSAQPRIRENNNNSFRTNSSPEGLPGERKNAQNA